MNAVVVVTPTVILIVVPPDAGTDVGRGKPGAKVSVGGPKLVPNTRKIDPWATEEFGNPTNAKLAALTTPPVNTDGPWALAEVVNTTVQAMSRASFFIE